MTKQTAESKTPMGRLRLGTSGYQYRDWKGRFYPQDMPQKAWFDYYAEQFDTVEINNTFYNLPTAETFDNWREAAPEGFEYALKFSRYGSHIKRLKDPEKSIPAFVEVAERLEKHLGPILLQLPPRWRVRPERLDTFLEQVPGKWRWVVELRDPSWFNEDVYEVLRKHAAALCIHDMLEDHPRVMTADWTYLRFHGDNYAGSYSSQFLVAEARRVVEQLQNGRDVYIYFNNTKQACGAQDALKLKRYINDRLAQ
ncbi:hypothetical protein HVA01_17320 [Halovibrio variabilis]|uniref:Histidine kinase n=1 Tax=Halovibrio variabilis TaxID=31910 RepID=A0A511UN85_9GAMM|nr:DUF72 domain-containing protein [Halovibrio variabilis]GEN28086.1 hypothetical protein HVA01_17320 [Halovibrio variabilis]